MVKELISKVDNGEGVILLTEMFGNTPSNLLISLIEENKIEMIGGINLPLLVKLGSLRENTNIEEVIKSAVEAGNKYVTDTQMKRRAEDLRGTPLTVS